MTLPELKEAKDSIAERDYTFGMPLEAKETPDPENRPQVDATIHLLSVKCSPYV